MAVIPLPRLSLLSYPLARWQLLRGSNPCTETIVPPVTGLETRKGSGIVGLRDVVKYGQPCLNHPARLDPVNFVVAQPVIHIDQKFLHLVLQEGFELR